MFPLVRAQKADMIQPVSSDEINLRDALVDRLRQSGIDVIDDVEDGQRVLYEVNSPAKMQAKRRALETASLGKNPRSLTVVSSADGAKVLQMNDGSMGPSVYFISNLTDENKDSKVLYLGYPSDILLSAGIVNKQIKLYGIKVIKKMKLLWI